MASSLSTKTLGLSLGADVSPENYLQINVPPRGMGITFKFQDHKLLGKFKITKDLKYSDDAEDLEIPEIISAPDIRKLKGAYLGQGFDTAVKLTDYSAYHDLKQDHFFKWIAKNDYFTKVENKTVKTPGFICFGGRITDPLQTPLITRCGDWEIYAAKYKDVIFLWDKKTGSGHNRTIQSYYGIAFEALMTGKDPKTVNEFEKVFIVQEASFGSTHQLLLVNEVDAVDDNGGYIEIKTFKKASPKAMQGKYLSYWGQSTVAGVKKMVIGERSDDGRLISTESISTDDILRKSSFSFSISKSLDFEDRLLTWIGRHFKENDPKIVKKFSWAGYPSSKIECETLSKGAESSFFPLWFLDSKQPTETAE